MLRRMDVQHFDALVIGAGIAGATVAAHLAADRRVALIEAEDAAGYHTTGRSAALWTANYGPPDARALTVLSRGFFEAPPPGFAGTALMSHRPVLTLALAGETAALGAAVAGGHGLRAIPTVQAQALVPALRPGHAAAAAVEDDGFDMDVAALHQGFLRQTRAHGGALALRSRTGRIERAGGQWRVEVIGGDRFEAPRAGQRRRRVGRRGGRAGRAGAAGAGAEAAHRRHHRPRALDRARLADDPGFRTDLVRQARRRARG